MYDINKNLRIYTSLYLKYFIYFSLPVYYISIFLTRRPNFLSNTDKSSKIVRIPVKHDRCKNETEYFLKFFS